jgi:hypothetical protein
MTTVTQANVYEQQQQRALYNMMNEASGPSAADSTSAAGSDGDQPTYLTPEALMVYCQTRLQGIDSQVQAAMTTQQNINWEQGQVGSLLNEISNDSAAAAGGVMSNPAECQTLSQSIEDLITQIQAKDPGCSQLAQLEQLHDAVMATGSGPYYTPNPDPSKPQVFHGYYNGGNSADPPTGQNPPSNVNSDHDNQMGTNELTNFTNTLNNINSSLGSGAEMGMINIQSLMSDRTTAIQLTTSILQSCDDGLSKIADNIGK